MNLTAVRQTLPRGATYAKCAAMYTAICAALMLSACAEKGAMDGPPLQTRSAAMCAMNGACGSKLDCEGRLVDIEGGVDPANIHDRSANPQFTIDKFILQPEGKRPALEVWLDKATQAERAAIFARVRAAAASRQRLQLRAEGVGVDAPITGACQRFLRFDVRAANSITTLTQK